ncbi:MAG: peptidase M1 [Saprospiraceae bacterium]|nr:peptidase M1 [Saprospiraceae bacterium]
MQRHILYLLLCFFGGFISNAQAQNDPSSNVDIVFYDIHVDLGIDQAQLDGRVTCNFTALEGGVSTLVLDLTDELKVSKVEGSKSFKQENNQLIIELDRTLGKGDNSNLVIFYGGVPPTVEKNKLEYGLLYKTQGSTNERIIASITYPNYTYLWLPCKNSSTDKIDSIHMHISIPDKKSVVEIVNPKTKKKEAKTIPYTAVSNGVLVKTSKEDNKKVYFWRHGYAIAPHHILIAISNFAKVPAGKFKGRTHEYPIEFYVLPEKYAEAKAMINRAPEIMKCLTKTFGKYPYHQEKFSITQLGFSIGERNGVPTQTNVLLESLKSLNISKLVNQTASMWFGNYISPETEEDYWITEGLASYAEPMWQEYKRGLGAVSIVLSERKEYFGPGKLVKEDNALIKTQLMSKKSAYVMHMLRGIMEDVYFFETLKGITSKKRMQKAKNKTYINTQLFQEICEYYASENYQVDYTDFFEQWISGEFYPIYKLEFENIKKGQVKVTIKQEQLESSPSFFTMSNIRLKMIFEDGTSVIEKIKKNKEITESFEFSYAQNVKDIIFDDGYWIFKDLKFVHQKIGDKFALTDMDISTSEDRRVVNISFNSSKKQDVLIQLYKISPVDGSEEKTSELPLSKIEGPQKQSFKIPLGASSRGKFIIKVIGKSDIYTKRLRINRLKSVF